MPNPRESLPKASSSEGTGDVVKLTLDQLHAPAKAMIDVYWRLISEDPEYQRGRIEGGIRMYTKNKLQMEVYYLQTKTGQALWVKKHKGPDAYEIDALNEWQITERFVGGFISHVDSSALGENDVTNTFEAISMVQDSMNSY